MSWKATLLLLLLLLLLEFAKVLDFVSHLCRSVICKTETVSLLLPQVMELAQGGSLLDYVRQRKRLAEPEACFFLQQIVHGLMHCHDMEVQSANPHHYVLFLFICM